MKKVAIISIFHICIPFPGCSIVLPRYRRNRVYKNKNQILFATPSPASHYQTKSAHPSYEEQADCLIIPLQAFCYISFFLSPSDFLLYFFLPYLFRLLAIFTSSLPHKASCYIYFFLSLYTSGGKSFYKELLAGDEDDEDR